jgi:Predicted membrane protein
MGLMSGPGETTSTGRPRRPAWRAALRQCLRDFREDQIPDRAAGLTYYAILSIFPGLVVLVSVLGLLGGPASGLNQILGAVVPGEAGELIQDAVNRVAATGAAAGFLAVAGLVVAFWSASGYVAAFLRALDAIHGVQTARPMKRALPLRLGLTALVGVLLIVCVFIVVFTGDLAERLGDVIGLGSTAVTVWGVAKWPGLLLLVAAVIAMLYRAGPPAEQKPRFVTPGSLAAVLLAVVVSVLFGVYLATFASYERTYGALSGVIVFLVWLWLTNMVVLLGAELDAALGRSRQPAGDGADSP